MFPAQNVLAGGLSAVIAWGLCQLAAYTGHPIDAATQSGLVIVVGFVIAHYVPLSAQDLVKRINDGIVHMAQQDPNSNVSYVLPPARVPPGEPAVIGGPPTVGGIATVVTPQVLPVVSGKGVAT